MNKKCLIFMILMQKKSSNAPKIGLFFSQGSISYFFLLISVGNMSWTLFREIHLLMYSVWNRFLKLEAICMGPRKSSSFLDKTNTSTDINNVITFTHLSQNDVRATVCSKTVFVL